MKKFILNFIIFILITNCGYIPLYSINNNKAYFEIRTISASGNEEINKNIKNNLRNLKSKNKNYEKIYDITISTNVEKIISSKDSKGNAKSYKMIVNTNLQAKIGEKEYQSKFETVEIYNDISSKFELENFEKNLKNNLALQITREIIIYLSTI